MSGPNTFYPSNLTPASDDRLVYLDPGTGKMVTQTRSQLHTLQSGETLDTSAGTTTTGAISATNLSASGTLGVTGTSTIAALSATAITASTTLGVTGTTTAAAINATAIAASTTLGVTGVTTPIGGTAPAGGTTIVLGRPGCVHTGGVPATLSGDGNNATPANTEIYYSEIFVPFNMSVTGISVFNGTVASDSWHRALLDADGALVTGSPTGAVASSGTDVYQKVPFTGGAITLLGPATYYVAQICSGNTDRYNAHGSATTELAFSLSMVAGKITGGSYAAIPGTNSLTLTFTTALGPIASLY